MSGLLEAVELLARQGVASAEGVEAYRLGDAWFVRMRCLLELGRGLQDRPGAQVMTLAMPAVTLRGEGREDVSVYGCMHVLRMPVGAEKRLEHLVSVHYGRWAARRAARRWVQLALGVAVQIERELTAVTT